MEVKIRQAEKKTITTNQMDRGDAEIMKKTKEQVVGHGLRQDAKRKGQPPVMMMMTTTDKLRYKSEELRLDSLKNWKTKLMMNTKANAKNGKKSGENAKKEEQKVEFRQNSTEKRQEENPKNQNKTTKPSHVWDCGSTLYDSFELNSFQRQLDSAISSTRSMSMPHRRLPPPHPSFYPELPALPEFSSGKKTPSSKISLRPLQKFIKSVFKSKQQKYSSSSAPSSPVLDRYFFVYDKSGALTTIPESTSETDSVVPEFNSLVRKTASERFSTTRAEAVIGLSCS